MSTLQLLIGEPEPVGQKPRINLIAKPHGNQRFLLVRAHTIKVFPFQFHVTF